MFLCAEAKEQPQRSSRKRSRETEFELSFPRKEKKQGVEIKFRDASFTTLYKYLFRYGSYFKNEFPDKPSVISHDSHAGCFGDVLRYLENPNVLAQVKELDVEYLKKLRHEAERFDIAVLKSKVNREILHRQYPDCFRVRLIEGSASSRYGSVDASQVISPLEGIYNQIDAPGDEDRPGYCQMKVRDHFFYYEGESWCFNITVCDNHPLKAMLPLLPMEDYGEIEIRSNPTSVHLSEENLGELRNLVWSGSIKNLESEQDVATLENIRFKFELIQHAEFATDGPLICS